MLAEALHHFGPLICGDCPIERPRIDLVGQISTCREIAWLIPVIVLTVIALTPRTTIRSCPLLRRINRFHIFRAWGPRASAFGSIPESQLSTVAQEVDNPAGTIPPFGGWHRRADVHAHVFSADICLARRTHNCRTGAPVFFGGGAPLGGAIWRAP